MSILTKKRLDFTIFFKYLIYFLLFYISFKANIFNGISCFCGGIFFALLWCNQNILGLSFGYIFASFICNFSPYELLGAVIFCVIISCIYLIHYKLKKPFNYIHLLIYACICSIPNLFVNLYFLETSIYPSLVNCIIGLLFTFACIKIFEAICIRGISARFTSTEIICGFCVLVIFFSGISQIELYEFSFLKMIVTLALFVCGYFTNYLCVLLLSASGALGHFLTYLNPNFFVLIIFYGLVLMIFKTKNKIISAVATIVIDLAFTFFFKFPTDLTVLSVLPVIVSSLIYILIPVKILDRLGNEFFDTMQSMTGKGIINKSRQLLNYKINELADIFDEMNRVYRGLIGEGLSKTDAKKMALSELKLKNCKNCAGFNKCHNFQNNETGNHLKTIIDCGFNKGKVTLLDIPNSFAGKCERLNGIVSTTNDLIGQYKNYAGLINNIDASKVLLAETFEGISDIMRDLSYEVNKSVNFENGKEKKIMDELTYNNIICSDVIVFEDEKNDKVVTLSVREKDGLRAGIVKVVSKICNQKMEVVESIKSYHAGWNLITLKASSKYDISFAVATKTKTGIQTSGDCYSVIKLKNDKYLLALCDGMGSGTNAQNLSSTAIGLIENFYKAGFNREIILSCVNKLLSMGKDDMFSALDICIVDCKSGIADFVKMGAPESFIKHKNTTSLVELSSLPLGIVQNANSKICQHFLTSGDKIILCTDGVCDSFDGDDSLLDFINNIIAVSPKVMADEILKKALTNNNGIARDDMSIIVAKIFEK